MDEIVSFAELERFIDLPVRTYSSGMYMRLGFAVAAHIEADTLLLDEVFAVGDEEFQRKCFAKIFEFKQRGGTIVFVSHDAASVERLCERAVLLRDGRVELDGSTQEAIARYHKLLADERDPAESAAGLREYGSGEARIVEARLLGPEGEERQQLAAAEPFTVELRVEAQEALPPPRRLARAPRRGRAPARPRRRRTPPSSAGRRRPASACSASTSTGRRSPTAGSGSGSSSPTASGQRLYHWLDDGVRFRRLPGRSRREARSCWQAGGRCRKRARREIGGR